MNLLSVCRHVAIILLGVFLLVGVPFICTGYFKNMLASKKTDSSSSAPLEVEVPSGDYIVLLNKRYHTENRDIEFWKKIFFDSEVGSSSDTISCSVPNGDIGAMELAFYYQSLLSENQFKIEISDPMLLVSRAEHVKFDVAIMSANFANALKFSLPDDDKILKLDVNVKEEGK